MSTDNSIQGNNTSSLTCKFVSLNYNGKPCKDSIVALVQRVKDTSSDVVVFSYQEASPNSYRQLTTQLRDDYAEIGHHSFRTVKAKGRLCVGQVVFAKKTTEECPFEVSNKSSYQAREKSGGLSNYFKWFNFGGVTSNITYQNQPLMTVSSLHLASRDENSRREESRRLYERVVGVDEIQGPWTYDDMKNHADSAPAFCGDFNNRFLYADSESEKDKTIRERMSEVFSGFELFLPEKYTYRGDKKPVNTDCENETIRKQDSKRTTMAGKPVCKGGIPDFFVTAGFDKENTSCVTLPVARYETESDHYLVERDCQVRPQDNDLERVKAWAKALVVVDESEQQSQTLRSLIGKAKEEDLADLFNYFHAIRLLEIEVKDRFAGTLQHDEEKAKEAALGLVSQLRINGVDYYSKENPDKNTTQKFKQQCKDQIDFVLNDKKGIGSQRNKNWFVRVFRTLINRISGHCRTNTYRQVQKIQERFNAARIFSDNKRRANSLGGKLSCSGQSSPRLHRSKSAPCLTSKVSI